MTLTLAEGVELCAAWSQHVMRRSGIRSLLIKGKALTHHGLRSERVSADVDILIDPLRFDEACTRLEAAGWRARPVPLINSHVSDHSRTYLHSEWPCDIDVHRHFPGFLAQPAIVFDELWERRSELTFGDIQVDIPDRASSLLVLALHSVRDGAVQFNHRADLVGLREVSLSDADRDAIAEVATATGGGESLGRFLPSLGVYLSPEQQRASAARSDPARLRAWQGRVASGSRGAYAWIIALRHAPRSQRTRLIGQAIWPSTTDLRISHPEVPELWWPVLRARGQRLVRGFRGVPGSIRALNLSRRH